VPSPALALTTTAAAAAATTTTFFSKYSHPWPAPNCPTAFFIKGFFIVALAPTPALG